MRRKKVIALLISLTLLVSIAIPGTLALSTDQTSSNGTIEVPTETTTPAPEAQQEQEGQNEQENICTCGSTGDRDRSIRTAGGAHGAEAGFHG